MRWMWIDRIIEFVPGRRMVAVKGVSTAEEYIHDHFEADPELGLEALPVMPASLIIEGMAQTAGTLVGYESKFKEKVVLAKVSRAEFDLDITPGYVLRFTTDIDRIDESGAATSGFVEFVDPANVNGTDIPATQVFAHIDLMFSHIDKNMSGLEFPSHNFVFGENMMTLLRTSGIEIPLDRD